MPDKFATDLQRRLGLSDSKMAEALKITRQTWRNWRTGKSFPPFAYQALIFMAELRRLDARNDNLPPAVRHTANDNHVN